MEGGSVDLHIRRCLPPVYFFFLPHHSHHHSLSFPLSHPFIERLLALLCRTAHGEHSPLQCSLQSLSPPSVSLVLQVMSLDSRAESFATMVSLTPRHLYSMEEMLTSCAPSHIFSAVVACRRISYPGLRASRRLPRHNHRPIRTEKGAGTLNRYAVLACHHCPDTP